MTPLVEVFGLADLSTLKRKHARTRLAVLGDALLSLAVVKALYADPTRSEGDISLNRQRYESAQAQAFFLRNGTDFESVFKLQGVKVLNEHSISTYFEAMLALRYETSLHEGTPKELSCRRIVRQYMKWIDDKTQRREFIFTPKLRGQVTLDGFLELEEEEHVLEQDIDSEPVRKKIDLRTNSNAMQRIQSLTERKLPIKKEASLEAAQALQSWVGISKAMEFGQHLATELKAVYWTSRQGYQYHDYYYPCCGRYACTVGYNLPPEPEPGQRKCSWWTLEEHEQRLIHTGVLRDIGGSKRAGGGTARGGSENHIPKGAPPRWSCCGRLHDELGCAGGITKQRLVRLVFD